MTLFDRERWTAKCDECGSAISVTSREKAEHLMTLHNGDCPDWAISIEKLDDREGAQ